MHLGTKKLAFMGLLMAVTVVMIILSGVLDFNTLFLLAAASFCVGIAFRESNTQTAAGFYLASLILGILLAPNKLYCITYAAMGLYILASEFSYDLLGKVKYKSTRKTLLWVVKYVIFNLMYIPALLYLPGTFYAGKISSGLIAGFIVIGQVALLVYDIAYVYFQGYVWGKLRRNLKL